ncbi:MAG: metallophosphoesterase, partial [Hyphomicrobiaceae bacterium]|nr:metallophosphoesterase [Hyphomicrobiaceae bacterium]
MRHLILMRGAPGVGKSTFIRAQGLEGYTVCPDEFRLRLGGIVSRSDGSMTISHSFEKRVWREVEEVLEFKMIQGQLIVFDATFQQARDFNLPIKLAERYGYKLHCIDFTNVPIEVALKRNQQRAAWKVVPEHVIHTAYERYESHALPKKIAPIIPDELGEQGLLDQLEPAPLDLSNYKRIVHIGDLQGCFAPLQELLKEGFDEETFYIFIGDLLDRGIQNGEVIRFAVDECLPRKNVAMIYGNHEIHIHRFAKNIQATSNDFRFNTLPQLKAAGFHRKEANTLIAKMVDALKYSFHGQQVLVTHAGLARIPERLAPLPSLHYWKGLGGYDFAVDEAFSSQDHNEGWLQVHGHRNKARLPVEAAPNSFNLEGEVEFGGHLRVMVLEHSEGKVGTSTREIKNDVYRRKQSDRSDEELLADGQSGEGMISAARLKRLDEHPLVKEKRFKSHPHIRSLNFTREAFFDGAWDEVNIMARGLFVADDRRIVARSYPKFFNMGERPETSMEALEKRLQFPIKCWVKENGFLGILGWDHLGDELFYTSKSTPESPFAGWLKKIFEAEVGEKGQKLTRNIIKNRNLCLVFEVNDPVRDPHMIAYDKPHLVLLDALKREEDFTPLGTSDREQIAQIIGL